MVILSPKGVRISFIIKGKILTGALRPEDDRGGKELNPRAAATPPLRMTMLLRTVTPRNDEEERLPLRQGELSPQVTEGIVTLC